MRIEIEFPYYAEFRVPGRRQPQREYLLGKAEFELRELDPATTRAACTMDVAWESGKDARRNTIEDSFDKAMFGSSPRPRPEGVVTLVSDGSTVFWPATSFRSGATLKLGDWLGGIQSREACETAMAAAMHPSNAIKRFGARPDFREVLRLDDILEACVPGDRAGVTCGKPRPRTAEEAGAGEFIDDTRDLCRAAITNGLQRLAVHDGLIVRDRGEPLYHVGHSLMDGVTMKVVASKELGHPAANLGSFPETQLFRIDRHADAVRHVDAKDGIPLEIPAVEVADWRPAADPVAIMIEKTYGSLNYTFKELRRRHSRWTAVPADLRAKIDGVFPPGEVASRRGADVFALMDLLEDCDRRLHPIYWARPDADARRPARELMEYTAALKARIENDLAGGVIELPSEGAPSPRP